MGYRARTRNGRKGIDKSSKNSLITQAKRRDMKILNVIGDNRRKEFRIETRKDQYILPFAILKLKPSLKDPIIEVYPDSEIGLEGFTYQLLSGKKDTVHLDIVLAFNRDPEYQRKQMLYSLTLTAQKLIKNEGVSKRFLLRRLKTSATQLYRLLDQTNYKKSIDQMCRLLTALGREVEFSVRHAD